jgi:hypothetical protein
VCDDRARLLQLGYEATSFAYPFGATDTTAKQIVQECGYSSGRGVGGIRSPGYGCNSCPTAESVPPGDVWEIATPQSVQSDTTLAMLQNYVTQAENNGGGWVPILFHRVCSGCASNAVSVSTFTAFADWLSKRPSTTAVRTVHEVVGGQVGPTPTTSPSTSPTTSPSPSPSSSPTQVPNPTRVVIGAQSHSIDGINVYRASNLLILYTPARGARTGTNQYGTEVAVVNGVVTQVQTSVGNMAIPSNGYVLSGHGTSNTWLRNNARVGSVVRLE